MIRRREPAARIAATTPPPKLNEPFIADATGNTWGETLAPEGSRASCDLPLDHVDVKFFQELDQTDKRQTDQSVRIADLYLLAQRDSQAF
jgi:hypothetical protein